MLSFFKLGLYSLTFAVDGLKTALNASQEGCIYRELLKGSYYIKVLQVLRTIPNYLGNISIGGIKEAGERFARVCWWGVIYIIVVYSKISR